MAAAQQLVTVIDGVWQLRRRRCCLCFANSTATDTLLCCKFDWARTAAVRVGQTKSMVFFYLMMRDLRKIEGLMER